MKQYVLKPELLSVIQKTVNPKAQYGRSVCCPFHNEKEPSLHIFENQSWYCFGCGKGGDVYDFLGFLRYGDLWNHNSREMFIEVKRELEDASFRNIHIDGGDRFEKKDLSPETMDTFRLAAGAYHKALVSGRDPGAVRAGEYLAGRGFSEKTIRNLKIGYAGRSELHRNGLLLEPGRRAEYIAGLRNAGLIRDGREYFYDRIIFPNITRNGDVVNLTGRALQPLSRRYLNVPNIRRNLYLLGLVDPEQDLYLTESVTDAVTLRQLGYSAAAVNGTSLSAHMAASLEPYKRIFIVPQNDIPSMNAASVWCEAVPRCRIVLPDYRDGEEKDVNDILRLEGEQRCGAKLRIAADRPMDCSEYLGTVRDKLISREEK